MKRVAWSIVAVFFLFGCDKETNNNADAGPGSGTKIDGGVSTDGGVGRNDGGTGTDGGTGIDGGTGTDGGTGNDGGTPVPVAENWIAFVASATTSEIFDDATLVGVEWRADGLGTATPVHLADDVAGYEEYGASDRGPRVSPRGSYVAWLSKSTGRLSVRPIDGSAPAREVSDMYVLAYSWSPDGSHLAAVGDRLTTYDLASGEERSCGQLMGDHPYYPRWKWAPDGSFVAYEKTYQDANSEWWSHLYVCNTADGALVDLAPTGGQDFGGFSDNGRVVYGKDNTIFVAAADGSDPVEVGPGIRPHAAPDGSGFLYTRAADPADTRGQLRTASWDGTGDTALGASTTVWAQDVSFSDDGSLAAVSDDGRLRVVSLDGTVDTVVSPEPDYLIGQLQPRFSRNGQRVAYKSDGGLRVGRTDTPASGVQVFDGFVSSVTFRPTASQAGESLAVLGSDTSVTTFSAAMVSPTADPAVYNVESQAIPGVGRSGFTSIAFGTPDEDGYVILSPNGPYGVEDPVITEADRIVVYELGSDILTAPPNWVDDDIAINNFAQSTPVVSTGQSVIPVDIP